MVRLLHNYDTTTVPSLTGCRRGAFCNLERLQIIMTTHQQLPAARDFRPLLIALFLGMSLFCGQVWAAETSPEDVDLPRNQWLSLPSDLTSEQRVTARRILDETEPRLMELHTRLLQTMDELRQLSFATDTHDDVLSQLGVRLVNTRDKLFNELVILRDRLHNEAGFTPEWDLQRGCNALQRQ